MSGRLGWPLGWGCPRCCSSPCSASGPAPTRLLQRPPTLTSALHADRVVVDGDDGDGVVVVVVEDDDDDDDDDAVVQRLSLSLAFLVGVSMIITTVNTTTIMIFPTSHQSKSRSSPPP
eukprot:3083082-Rhodomonas_salina.1